MDTRDTLREFSLKATSKTGVNFHIFYGYDLSKSTPTYYVKASINGETASSSKKVLSRVQKLGIEPINRLIDLIGCDETGAAHNFYDVTLDRLQDYFAVRTSGKSVDAIASLLCIESDQDLKKLDATLEKLVGMDSQGKTPKAITSAYTRYLNTHRLRLLMNVRETIQSLRKLYYKGTEVNGNSCKVSFEGYLKQNHYPTYYKRDMDLIRASRIRIYNEVLKREYVPVKD